MDRSNKKMHYVDALSGVIFAPFNSIFFYFTVVMFIVHKNNIHTNSLRILTLHFLLRAIGDSLNAARNLVSDNDSQHKTAVTWNLASISYFFWYGGEIIGDFYLLSRTTPFILSPFKNIRLILSYITYLLLAIGKFSVIISHLIYPYFTDVKYGTNYYYGFWKKFWDIQLYISFLSMVYDVIIYFTMKVDFFDKDLVSEVEENRAWKKYRKMSRIRVKYVAIVAAITFLFVLFSKFKYLKSAISFVQLEYYRSLLVTMPYAMMYIDQILISETDMIPFNESIVHMNLYTYQ